MHFVLLWLHASAANAVTDGAAVGPARVVISSSCRRAACVHLYAPIIETLRAGFLHATPHTSLSGAAAAPLALHRGRELSSSSSAATCVHVGPWGHEMVPWHDLKRRGVIAVYDQTEPVDNCYDSKRGALPNTYPEPQEIWDFAWHNLDACARQLRRLGDNMTLRYVPPGFIAPPVLEAAAWPAAPRLLFMGYPFFKSGRGRCYAALHRTLGERLNATWSLWSAAAFDTCGRRRGSAPPTSTCTSTAATGTSSRPPASASHHCSRAAPSSSPSGATKGTRPSTQASCTSPS